MEMFYRLAAKLPQPWAEQLARVPEVFAAQISEIRLRSGCPVAVTVRGKSCFVREDGSLCTAGETTYDAAPLLGQDIAAEKKLPVISHQQLQTCFLHLCSYSVFTYEEQLRQGFFTLAEGHRVGVASSAVRRNGVLCQPQTVYALALRVARFLPLVEKERWAGLLGSVRSGLLLVGPPGSGKTTVLRGLAALLSANGLRVTVADERCELFPAGQEGFCLPLPWNCDVLSGYPKAAALEMSVRTLSPQVVLCDELGTKEVPPLLQGLNSGVGFVASLHAADREELERRTAWKLLRAAHAVDLAVFLHGSDVPGSIREVYRADA